MTSWQRRMAAVDRRFTFQATIVEVEPVGSVPDTGAGDSPAGVEVSRDDPVTALPSPGTAARLAALLREDERVLTHPRMRLAGTA